MEERIRRITARSLAGMHGPIDRVVAGRVAQCPLFVLADTHGRFDWALYSLRTAGLIDGKGNWGR